jgi:hypothetical protein
VRSRSNASTTKRSGDASGAARGFWLGARRGRVRRSFGREVLEVQRAVAPLAHVHVQPRHLHLLEVQALRGDVTLAQRHGEVRELGQRRQARRVPLLDVERVQRDRALDGELGRVGARANEGDVERKPEAPRLQRDGQPHRHERHVLGQLERAQAQLEHGLE